MPKKVDVIIVGAGLGGLSAATMLARNGLEVLLLERHTVPGGYATSFMRGRYEFEVSLHELSGIGPPERRASLYRYLDYLGVAEKIEFINIPNLFRTIYPDLDLILPVGPEAFEAKLCETFPHEKAGIQRFLKRVFDLRQDFIRITKQRGPGRMLTLPFRMPHFFRYAPTTWSQVLNRDVKDPLARAVLSQYWGYVGLPPSKISFLYFATTLAAYVKSGPAFPKGRSQALSNAFVARIEQLGGEVRMNCGVQQITTSHGRITGVITEGGEEICTDWVVSNADPISTCRELISLDHVPQAFFRKLQSSELSPSTLNVYLGINKPAKALGLDEHEIFINENTDFDHHYELMHTLEHVPALAVTCYNSVYPDISPPGTCMVVLTALAYAEPWYKVQPEAYIGMKNHVGEQMIQLAEKISPDLRTHAEVVEVATPITNMRYAGALGGSIYGFNQPPRDNLVWRMGARGPVDGLYFVGAWTRPGAGFEPAIFSGQIAGGAILSKVKKNRGEKQDGR